MPTTLAICEANFAVTKQEKASQHNIKLQSFVSQKWPCEEMKTKHSLWYHLVQSLPSPLSTGQAVVQEPNHKTLHWRHPVYHIYTVRRGLSQDVAVMVYCMRLVCDAYKK